MSKNLLQRGGAPRAAAPPAQRRGLLVVRRFKENGTVPAVPSAPAPAKAAAPTATAKVTFTLPRHVPFGQEIAVVGAAESLGERTGRARRGAGEHAVRRRSKRELPSPATSVSKPPHRTAAYRQPNDKPDCAGSWDAAAAVPLTWTEGDIWTATAEVPVG